MNFADLPIYASLFLMLYMLTLFFIAFFEELEQEKQNAKRKKIKYLNAAIFVPAYNEEDTIEGTIDSLLNLKYPKNKFKIYVIDDGSKDNTWQVLQKYKNNKQVILLKKSNGGKASALNFALSRVQNDVDIIGVLDADSFVKKDALFEIVKKFNEDENIAAVTPGIKIWNPNTIVRFLQNAEYNLSIYLRKAFDNLGTIFIIPGPFSFYRKEALLKAGPWKHAHGTEDLEMGLRFQDLGFKIVNNPRAVVYTVSPATAKKLYKQRLRWTYGFLNNAIDYKHLFFNPNRKALSYFMLPSAVLGIVFSAYIFFYSIYLFVSNSIEKISLWYNYGLELSLPSFDTFFMHLNLIFWLAAITIVAAIFATYLGDKASGEPNLKVKDVITYVFLYGFIAPIWLISSIIRTIARREVKWVKVNR